MRIVLQRVSQANVVVDDATVGSIDQGLVLLVGVAPEDNKDDINWLVKKILTLRIFSNEVGKMDLSVNDIGGSILIISQFTLFASIKKGTRPSFTRSANPTIAIPIYEGLISTFEAMAPELNIQTGIFGADMKVSLTNDGPVTINLDSKNKE